MKKIMLIAVMAIVSTGVFAAKSSRKIGNTKKGLNACTYVQKSNIYGLCNGRMTIISIRSVSYDCSTDCVTNIDFWFPSNGCVTQLQNALMG